LHVSGLFWIYQRVRVPVAWIPWRIGKFGMTVGIGATELVDEDMVGVGKSSKSGTIILAGKKMNVKKKKIEIVE
jgi:hypothetical protein